MVYARWQRTPSTTKTTEVRRSHSGAQTHYIPLLLCVTDVSASPHTILRKIEITFLTNSQTLRRHRFCAYLSQQKYKTHRNARLRYARIHTTEHNNATRTDVGHGLRAETCAYSIGEFVFTNPQRCRSTRRARREHMESNKHTYRLKWSIRYTPSAW